jgi:adenine specific DNA methylase Mod
VDRLFYGDNLEVMREHVESASVDLVYLDPPFNSQATYNLLFRTPKGDAAEAQMEAFQDTWRWGPAAETAYADVLRSGSSAATMLAALRSFLGDSNLMAYLAMMAVRLIELRRVLKPTGSLYLHCDPTASHYLKVLLDGTFGADRFVSEIVWRRTNARGTSGRWPRLHDVLLCYSRSASFTFEPQRIKGDKTKLPHTLITGRTGESIKPTS